MKFKGSNLICFVQIFEVEVAIWSSRFSSQVWDVGDLTHQIFKHEKDWGWTSFALHIYY